MTALFLIPLAILILGMDRLLTTRRIVKAGARLPALRIRSQNGPAMSDSHQPWGIFPIVETSFHGAQ